MDLNKNNDPVENAKSSSSQTAQTPAVPVSTKPAKHGALFILLLVAVFLGGAVWSYFFYPLLSSFGHKQLPSVEVKSNKIVLPSNAVLIQKCANNKGALYVEPQNIPVGPVYMVSNGEVIGIEFMLGKDEFLQGKSYKDLQGLGMEIDHVNIGLLSEGHEGYALPHYHVDIYTVSKEVEIVITCPASPAADPVSQSPIPSIPVTISQTQ